MRIAIAWLLSTVLTLLMRWLRRWIQRRKGIVPFTAPRRILVISYVLWAGFLAPVGLFVATAGVMYWQFLVQPHRAGSDELRVDSHDSDLADERWQDYVARSLQAEARATTNTQKEAL